MCSNQSEYAKAGVDYTKIEPFKRAMLKVGKQTLDLPQRAYNVSVRSGAHGAIFQYLGQLTHAWCQVQEGLGNKNWIAEWMRQYAGTGKTYYDWIGWDVVLMSVNDLIAQGAMPIAYTDEVAAGDSEWFQDEKRAQDLAKGFLAICQEIGMALPAGESPALRYLIKAEPPVNSAPSLSGCAIGIIAPTSMEIIGQALQPGDIILGAPSSGLHCNGISLIIKRALDLPAKFLTKLPNGKTLGEEALIPTKSYVSLIKALLDNNIKPHALLPGTGSGIAKIAYDTRLYTYRIANWVDEIPPLFLYMKELGVSLIDCLTTFNWGIGYYIYIGPEQLNQAMDISKKAGYDLIELGRVEKGERKVIFEPENITLPPPGE